MKRYTKRDMYVFTMEYYSAIERYEVLIHATMWMEISQIQKKISCDSTYIKYLDRGGEGGGRGDWDGEHM